MRIADTVCPDVDRAAGLRYFLLLIEHEPISEQRLVGALHAWVLGLPRLAQDIVLACSVRRRMRCRGQSDSQCHVFRVVSAED